MQAKTETSKSPPGVSWELLHGLLIHADFFKKGLVVVATDQHEKATDINVASHTLTFSSPEKKPRAREFKKGQKLLHQLTKYSSKSDIPISSPQSDVCLFNAKRAGEIFFPIGLSSANGMYVLPWSGKPLDANFDGFERFVTAGCMFGGALQAVLTDKSRIPLIDHALVLPPPNMVEEIEYNTEMANPFEMVLFHEFEKNCEMIKALTKQGQRPKILHHLPAEDYMLFGFKLYIQGKMSKPALDKLLQSVLVQKQEHTTKLHTLCSHYGIDLELTSPFENIFSGLHAPLTTDTVCTLLGLDMQQKITAQEVEKNMTQICLKLLQKNGRNTTHQLLWTQLTDSPSSVNDIESLFHVGNALIIAQGANNKQDNQVCSILPLSEKQIQVQYDVLKKHSAVPLPSVVNLTTLDPVITYSPTSKGLIFYLMLALDNLGKLLKEDGVLQAASKNLKFFSESDTPETQSNLSELQGIGCKHKG
ncbi:MAG: hypothetical protein JJT82_03545 [Legionellaceae bacterium]|nr:hypothetical protein [Legionellaceae bacterium]